MVHSGPTEGEDCDLLVMESTYGNREHPHTDPRPQMAALIRTTVQRGGSVVVPSFAVERTQKFLFLLKELMESETGPERARTCRQPDGDQGGGDFPEARGRVHAGDEGADREVRLAAGVAELPLRCTQDESKKINDSRYPSIIVSSSGMVTGGRILHHLMLRLPDPRNLVLFIGFQAPGTRGFTIKNGATEVKMFGQEIPIRAQVAALEQFSDHADTPELLEWLHTFRRPPKQTYLVHGEPQASSQLRDAMTQGLAMERAGGGVPAEGAGGVTGGFRIWFTAV